MATVTVEYEANQINDPYLRFVGRAVDEELPDRWWDNPRFVLGLANGIFYWVEDLELEPGEHTISCSISTALSYRWHVKLSVDGEVEGEGDIGAGGSLAVLFTVGGEPPKTVKATLIADGYNPWEKVSEVVPEELREMTVLGCPDQAKRGEEISILVKDTETQGPLAGAVVSEDGGHVAVTDEAGVATWPFAQGEGDG